MIRSLLLLRHPTGLCNVCLNLLHEVNKLLESNLGVFSLAHFGNKVIDFGWVSLKTSHDCVEVLGLNSALLLSVKEVENFTQILNFVFREGRLSSRRCHFILAKQLLVFVLRRLMGELRSTIICLFHMMHLFLIIFFLLILLHIKISRSAKSHQQLCKHTYLILLFFLLLLHVSGMSFLVSLVHLYFN